MLFPLVAHAAEHQIPSILLYQGKPIDALCFFEAAESEGVADLAQCGLHAEAGRGISGQNKLLTAKGFVGYDYHWQVEGGSDMQGYSYYKPFGMVAESAIVELLNNSGGTGQFSTLSLVARTGNKIKVTSLHGGDRCNGGLVKVVRKKSGAEEYLQYSVNVTTYDLLSLAGEPVKAYDDLEACAICCKAVAIFQRPISADIAKEKLLYVDLSAYPQSEGEAAANTPYQTCFNKFLQTYQRKNTSRLDLKGLQRFVQQFNEQCVSHSGS
ncbi:Uncharacterised protein [Legionella longbeachae]|uniref:Uncharacterized protein n=1 Tax=Legionella oakridgensis TaxID=29423 RepID=A0A0W0WXA1_9GAMM|nr:hypothetical protein LOR_40c04950 [Legionella oakridgensis RV-2-2007]KTD36922.1 hypothetical protein Loak_2058 [Legionella oakridgensis]STY20769.1 Uncharacterised protein [Legionella longbeachae]